MFSAQWTWIFALVPLLNSGRLLSLSIGTWSGARYFLPCLANITSRHDDGTDFLFLSEELEYPIPSDEILRIIRRPVVIRRETQFSGYFGFFVLFPPTTEKSYESLLKIIHLSYYNKFVVVWPHQNITSDSLIPLINQFWSFRLLDIVILTRSSATAIHVYGYDPFLPSSCHLPRLVRLDVWSIPQNKFIYNSNLFTFLKSRSFNFNGCSLTCFAKSRPPDALVRRVGTEWQLEGVGGQFMKLLSKRLNFTSIIEVPKADASADKYGYDISSGIPELVTALLVNHSIDLAFGIYSHMLYFKKGTEFPSTAVSECWGWAVPAHAGRIIPAWMYYTGEFNTLVWFSILLAYLASVILVYLCSKLSHPLPTGFHSPTLVALYMFAVTLNKPATRRIALTKLRIIITMFALHSLVISSTYVSSMASLQAVPWRRENIRTFQEILDARFQLKGTPQSTKILKDKTEDDAILQKLSAHYHTHRGYFEEIIRQMQRDRNIATFAAQRFLQFYINEELNKTGRDDVYLIPECVIQAHTSPFLLKQGSPFLRTINWIILVAVEAGLTQYWFTYLTPKITLSPLSEGVHSLSADKLTFVFVILFTGLSLSFLTFLVEVISCRRFVRRMSVRSCGVIQSSGDLESGAPAFN